MTVKELEDQVAILREIRDLLRQRPPPPCDRDTTIAILREIRDSLRYHPPSLSPLTTKWSCKACTFTNSGPKSNCKVCGTRYSVTLISDFEELDSICSNKELDSTVGPVFFPLQPCKRKNQETDSNGEASEGFRDLGFFSSAKVSRKEVTLINNITPNVDSSALKILTYNVWFREDLEIYKKMKALGDLIQQHSPDVICFEEVTPNIYSIFQQTSWWKAYHCSVSTEMSDARPYFCMQFSKLPIKSFNCKPVSNSLMGRELCVAEVDVKAGKTIPNVVANLEEARDKQGRKLECLFVFGLPYCNSSCSIIMLNTVVLSSYGFDPGISSMFYQKLKLGANVFSEPHLPTLADVSAWEVETVLDRGIFKKNHHVVTLKRKLFGRITMNILLYSGRCVLRTSLASRG